MVTKILHIDFEDGKYAYETGGVDAELLGDALATMVTSCENIQGQNMLLTGVLYATLRLLKDSDPACVAMFSDDVTRILREKLTNQKIS